MAAFEAWRSLVHADCDHTGSTGTAAVSMGEAGQVADLDTLKMSLLGKFEEYEWNWWATMLLLAEHNVALFQSQILVAGKHFARKPSQYLFRYSAMNGCAFITGVGLSQ